MNNPLSHIEVRILGSLIEKKLSTPDNYPLTLNSLTLACNQKTSRNPVTEYSEDSVHSAVKGLIEKRLAWESTLGRAPKYEENFLKSYSLDNPEAALICVIMLRGSQTPGELRINSEKMHTFNSYEDLIDAMEILFDKQLIIRLPRQPGQKEHRITHLLCGEPEINTGIQNTPEHVMPSVSEDIITELAAIRKELEELKASFQKFKSQFE
ncbi:MAG TPA: YceH family protein [Desulfomonilia bacterium]